MCQCVASYRRLCLALLVSFHSCNCVFTELWGDSGFHTMDLTHSCMSSAEHGEVLMRRKPSSLVFKGCYATTTFCGQGLFFILMISSLKPLPRLQSLKSTSHDLSQLSIHTNGCSMLHSVRYCKVLLPDRLQWETPPARDLPQLLM